MDTIGNWLRKNANVVIILLAIFGLALFLRAYFPLGESIQEHLLSGGSDSFYWERTIRHVVTTGKQLDWDPLLNYPMGLGNPRPPLFNWFVALPGIVFSPLVGDVWQSVIDSLILSTAIWGALTIFPTYFLTKNIFGRRAGLIAAFLLAIMPAHLQRSQATDADHDAMTLFFVVTSFFFFMKALKALRDRRWVASWNVATKDGRSSISAGSKSFFAENQKAVLYSVMSGLAMGSVALAWQGWAYAPIILIVYAVLQLFVDRIRGRDPMGMGICFTITMGTALLIAAPWYVLYGQVKVWFDVPLILFLVAAALGFVLTVTRNYPWALVIPTILIIGSVILVTLVIVSPTVATAFVSGAGYFVRTKLYETIAEAQPPGISQAILSFGAATYYLSLFGLFWMAWKLPKRLQSDYLFILTWSFAAIFMSMAAARFIFNAGPAFALTAGWVIGLLIEKLDFEKMKKTFSSLAGGSKLTALRKSVKIKHVLGSLFIVCLLLVPNVWFGLDASIPYEQKAQYDRQVYYTLPDFMRPQGYTPGTSSGTHYFGAFGYSLPLPKSYFPAAWDWFATQDTSTPIEQRPAYLSWWDYGFEAVDRGEHPTVADNFQDGYQLAGQFITEQSEGGAISLLTLRLIEGDYYGNKGQLSVGVSSALQRYGLDPSKIVGSYRNPSPLIDVILNDPITYGTWDSRMQAQNALYIYLRQYFTSTLSTDQIASLYHDIRGITGWSIRYFGVDSRMFPVDGGGNNIFYAPVKLSDHRVQDLPDGRVLPIDFFNIDAQTDKGTFPVALVPPGATISSLDIKYTDMFYNSMFYRAYMGFGPKDVNQACTSNDCLPGIRGDLQTMMPMQGWNMSHFKVVYKTAYFNPWGVSQYQNHSSDWQAVNYFDALNMQRKISRGEMDGVIDFSNNTLARSGVVFLKYYDGAYVNGTVTVDGVTPLAGVRVTVLDYEDPSNPTPHDSDITDADGRYSILAPFGDVTIVASIGALDPRTQTGATILDQEFLHIFDDQAMRLNVDRDGDGFPDYEIHRDLTVRGVTITGHAFLDVNKDKNLTYGEDVVANSQISFKHTDLGLVRNVTTDADGAFMLSHAYEGTYVPTVSFRGRTFAAGDLKVGKTDAVLNIPINTTKLEGLVTLPGDFTASGAFIEAYDEAWGSSVITNASSAGKYSFDLLPGNFTVTAVLGFNATLPHHLHIGGLTTTTFNMTLSPSGVIKGETSVGGLLQGNVLLTFTRVGATVVTVMATSDSTGSFSASLPAGIYEVHVRHYIGGNLYAFLGRATVTEGQDTVFDPTLSEGVVLQGVIYSVDKTKGGISGLNVSFWNGQGTLSVKSSLEGMYVAYLPQGDYTVQAGYYNLTYLKRERLTTSRDYDVHLQVGILVTGQVYYDKNRDGIIEPGEGAEDTRVAFADPNGLTGETFARTEGRYELTLPGGTTYVMSFSKAGFQTLSIGPATLQALAPRFTSQIAPMNITVFGRLMVQGSPLTGQSVEVGFIPKGVGAVQASFLSDPVTGAYTADVAPGGYEVKVDQAVVAGQDDVRFMNVKTELLVLKVGQPSSTRDLSVSVKARVSGEVNVQGHLRSASMVFQGPETSQFVAENGSFSVMLALGDYTLYASYNQSGTAYATFQALTVMAPLLNIQIGLDQATRVEGSMMYGGSPLMEVAPVSLVSDQGVKFDTLTSTEGRYSADLVPGNYTIRVAFRSNATIDYVTRFVRYDYLSILTVRAGQVFLTQNLNLTRSLDNSTLKGRLVYNGLPAAASLEFRPDSVDGINATGVASSDGTYSIELAPGPYVMYVHDLLTQGVSLQRVIVEPRTSTYLNLSLEKGYKVSGVTRYLDKVRIGSRVAFSNSVNWEVWTDSNGYFEVYVPAARYTIRVTAIIQEHGLNVGYNESGFVIVSGDTPIIFDLARIPRRGIYLSYDPKRDDRGNVANYTVSAGGTIEIPVKVWNSGSMPDEFKLEGATVGWTITFDRDTVPVDFGTVNGNPVNTTYVTASVRAPSDATVDHAPVSITGHSVNETITRYTLRITVDVTRTHGIVLRTTETKPIFDGRYLNYTLEIANTGNAVERVGMEMMSPDLSLLGWDAQIKSNATTPAKAKVEGILVGANATTRVTVVIESTGGAVGVEVLLRAYLQDSNAESYLKISTVLPQLQLEGTVAVVGIGLERQAPISLTLIAITVSLGFVAALFLVMTVRDRLRRRRR